MDRVLSKKKVGPQVLGLVRSRKKDKKTEHFLAYVKDGLIGKPIENSERTRYASAKELYDKMSEG